MTTIDLKHKDKLIRAVFYCIGCHLMFAIMGACAKYLSTDHHVTEIVFYRSLIFLIPFIGYLAIKKQLGALRNIGKPKLLAFRAIVGATSIIVTYGAISYLPMSYATVLFFGSTILSPVFAHFVLKEYIRFHRWAAVFVGMCGVLIIAQPSGAVSMIGLILGLAAATLHAMMYTSLRLLKSENPLVVTFYFILAGTILPMFFLPFIANPPQLPEMPIFILLGITGGLGQIFLTSAYKYAPVSFITPFAYTALLWSVLFDVFVWKIDLDFTSVFAGAFLILCAQLYIIHREYVRKVQRETPNTVDK
jgi:drug/metabolite transporter (DMT)-like permease